MEEGKRSKEYNQGYEDAKRTSLKKKNKNIYRRI